MTPVDMLIKHDPEKGAIGDCFRCCIASLLDMRAEYVPHFMKKDWGKEEKDLTWFKELQYWLSTRGLAYLDLIVQKEFCGTNWFEKIGAGGFDAYHIISGVSPRGYRHAVVGRNGIIVHDPHPDRSGLITPEDEGWCYGFIIKTGLR